MTENSERTAAPAIEARGLEKSYGENRALRGIDLTVRSGERLVVFGPNGAGKTTLLKLLSTLAKPSAGSVRLNGLDAGGKGSRIRRQVSLVSHLTFLYDDLTIHENLEFYGRMYDVTGLENRIREVTAWVRLESRLHDRVGTLSRGLQQRVSIARAVLHEPSILFLDEPEIGLDPQAATVIRDILENIGSGGRTVVMTTHNLERGLSLGDRIIIMDRGKIVYDAPGHELNETTVKQVYDRCTDTEK